MARKFLGVKLRRSTEAQWIKVKELSIVKRYYGSIKGNLQKMFGDDDESSVSAVEKKKKEGKKAIQLVDMEEISVAYGSFSAKFTRNGKALQLSDDEGAVKKDKVIQLADDEGNGGSFPAKLTRK